MGNGDDAQPRAFVPMSESERFSADYENAVAILAQPRKGHWIVLIQEGESFVDPAEAERRLFAIRERRRSDSMQILPVRVAPNCPHEEAVNDPYDTPKKSTARHSSNLGGPTYLLRELKWRGDTLGFAEQVPALWILRDLKDEAIHPWRKLIPMPSTVNHGRGSDHAPASKRCTATYSFIGR